MMKINLSSPMRSNLLSLQQTARLYDTTSLRLATGLKINSALDSPNAFYTASSLQHRAGDLSRLLDAMTQGIQVLKAASQTLESLTAFLDQATALANQAAGEIKELPPPTKGYVTKTWLIANGTAEEDIITTKDQLLSRLTTAKSGDRLIIFANIDMGDVGISLKDGVTLSGAEALLREAGVEKDLHVADVNQAQLGFKFTSTASAIGIDLGNNAHLSDIKIDYFSQNKGNSEKFVAINNSSGTSELNNIDLKIDGGAGSGSITGVFSNNSIKINGKLNIESSATSGLTAISNSLSKGVVSQGLNSVINIRHRSNAVAISVGTFNSYGDINIDSTSSAMNVVNFEQHGKVNIYTHGNSAYGISTGGTVNIYGSVNILTTGNTSTAYRQLMSSYKGTNVYGQLNISLTGSWSRAINTDITAKSGSQIHMYNGKSQLEASLIYEAGALISMNDSSGDHVWRTTAVGSIPKGNYNSLDGFADFTALSQKAPAFPNIIAEVNTAWDKSQEPKEKTLVVADTDVDDGPQYLLSANYNISYQNLLRQYNSALKDGKYQGVNLLDGDSLKLVFNENHSAFLQINGFHADGQSIGLLAADWETPSDIMATIDSLGIAVNRLRTISIELGNNYHIASTRSNFTENLITLLNEGANKLILADMNEEAANSLLLDTRRQLGINALSLASQASQAVLKLF